MDKKPLIGVSNCAVVLLVLGSLTNVVGCQSVKSTTVNDSPLFNMRTQKATNQKQNIITSQYLGKGNRWQFPMRDNRTEQLKKAIDIISKLDDKTFARFTALCIQHAKQDNTLGDTSPNEITRVLNQLRTKSETIPYSFTNRNYQNKTLLDLVTIKNWYPGCILQVVLIIIFLILLSINPPWTLFCGPGNENL